VLLEVMPDTDDRIAEMLAERIRSVIAKSPARYDGIDIPMTLSIGVASKSHAKSLDELLMHADNAMYAAKAAGRNRVSVYIPIEITETAAT